MAQKKTYPSKMIKIELEVDKLMFMLFARVIKMNEEGLVEFLEKEVGLLEKGKEGIENIINVLYDKADELVMNFDEK